MNKVPTKKNLNEYYKKFDYTDVTTAEPTIRKDANRSLKLINAFLQPKKVKKILDIGCGRGFFLDEARRQGWIVHGIDASDSMVEYAQKKLKLKIEKGDIFKLRLNDKFDLITLNQIIEHLPNPKELIEKCRELLKLGGLIYIATPNIGSIVSKVSKEHFDHLIPPEHLGYYEKTTLAKLLEELGFRVLYSGSWSYSSDLAGIIKLLFKKKKKTVSGLEKLNFSTSVSLKKKIKYILFDRLFCRLFYKLLNLDSFGVMLDMIAIKQ